VTSREHASASAAAIKRFIRATTRLDDPNLLHHRNATFMQKVTALFKRTIIRTTVPSCVACAESRATSR
jgi:hypothetical protein